ncbi:MAG: MlaA family lipoprotein, partial [Gammaproteobacteria bacterium]
MHRIGAGVIERITHACVCASLLLAPVAATQAATEEDPWEAVNRPIFRFNDTLDTYALKPLAQGYQAITPQFLEDGIHNIFRNLGDVTNLANNVLQLKPHAAGGQRTGRAACRTPAPLTPRPSCSWCAR